ncbi:DUF3306 domain-containing protein [Halomonas nitroreducens]|uniref:DUF3306 domain-containing protein n=1 Tax=Halomonas nitroreducens TaxID=447425 RepID=A0A3S0HTD1_9GAMM|nr:DUF3306 domain-containing protein [Halomonas nitroreducens]RTR05013.1 DUF3306 domain-containing protein [Halomonas nitroreducens]
MSHWQRWSRRKRGITGDEVGDAAAPPAHGEGLAAEDIADPDAVATPAAAAEADLPDPDSLPPGSDITAFMAPGISAGLRRRALKRLFAADHYAIRDGLDDYDQDFRRTLTPLAGQAAERLRRWLGEPGDAHDEGAVGEPPEVADDALPSPGDTPGDEGARQAPPPAETEENAKQDDDSVRRVANEAAHTPSPGPGAAPLDQGPLARNEKATKTS